METKMLRWTAGVTRLDRIRNEAIRKKFGVAPIADKMRGARMRWYFTMTCSELLSCLNYLSLSCQFKEAEDRG
ncbi:unnamed protein product [Heligmosomoides polygyrus]|uniref:HTH_48 domain-containing protein n=1 Tax=Heligmosomoides polygyrus TaxID=6339 RepID=A0A183G0I3_HELPZ|nr:unnamed protein product [Heligmosomoides polygyrus]